MAEHKFDPSVPRKMYPLSVIPLKNRCPACGAKLEKEHHSYAVSLAGEAGKQLLLVGNEFGFFCPKCNVVVLDTDGFAREITLGLSPKTKGTKFVVLGIVDMNAIPKEKWNVPLGSEGNPIPLVKFTNLFRKTSH